MTRRANIFSLIAVVFATASSTFGCGGRTDDGDTAGGDSSNPGAPPPTCAEICSHIVNACSPGASLDHCVRDCSETTIKFAACSALDPYLRCLPSVIVTCKGIDAVIEGCDTERTALEACPP